MTRFTSFDALLSRFSGGQVTPPYEGEPAGDRCPLCKVQPEYRRTENGAWRIHMVHGPHGPKPDVHTPDLLPPRRPHWTDDDED